MSSWAALNWSIICFSTATCSGASPAPRQQNQRMTVVPGFCGPTTTGVGIGVAEGAADSDAVWPIRDGEAACNGPAAASAAMTTAAQIAAGRTRRDFMLHLVSA